ncbi:histone H1C-like [Platysternon megacephalum]|uniref:Histone H1C-like n=1 Tax=Platysternon megacephalum TaxID=55544 RepID=A0A4D9ESG2_9SAUR|nr:histone H1C-like [Platysternon megacephalum]
MPYFAPLRTGKTQPRSSGFLLPKCQLLLLNFCPTGPGCRYRCWYYAARPCAGACSSSEVLALPGGTEKKKISAHNGESACLETECGEAQWNCLPLPVEGSHRRRISEVGRSLHGSTICHYTVH